MPAKPRFQIAASVTPEEHDLLEAARQKQGITMYELLRGAVLDRAREILGKSRK